MLMEVKDGGSLEVAVKLKRKVMMPDKEHRQARGRDGKVIGCVNGERELRDQPK